MKINLKDSKNLSMMVDFHELATAAGYFSTGKADTIAYFDLFFRTVPDAGGFVIAAGLEQLMDYLQNLAFSSEDLDFLRGKGFKEDFLAYLENFKFSCDVWAVPEGTPVFPGEPILIVRGPIIQAQLLETMALMLINHQTLIATKANRIARAAQGRAVFEFGARRAYGADAAFYGARASYIGGVSASSLALADMALGIEAVTTMTHSWVEMFDSELEAFCAFAREFPEDCSLLVDTYNTLKSGLPNAIEAFNRELTPKGYRPKSIRLDSGDIAYLSRKARKILDEAGYPDCEIVASNSLDEYLIRDMINQGAKIDAFAVGERLITSASSPILGGVYKLSAVEKDGQIIPKIKITGNVTKITTPCVKRAYRLIDKDTGKAIADLVCLADEQIGENEPYELFDPDYTWKRKTVENFIARPLLQEIFKEGKLVYRLPSLDEIRDYCTREIDSLWEEVLRFENPHKYYVDLSQALWDKKQETIAQHRKL